MSSNDKKRTQCMGGAAERISDARCYAWLALRHGFSYSQTL